MDLDALYYATAGGRMIVTTNQLPHELNGIRATIANQWILTSGLIEPVLFPDDYKGSDTKQDNSLPWYIV